MRTAPNLYRKKSGIWSHQRRVPLRLVAFFGGSIFWKISLRTKDDREARQLGAVRDLELDRLIADADIALADGWASWRDFQEARRPNTGPSFITVPEPIFVAGLVSHFRSRLDRFKNEAAGVRSMDDAMRLLAEVHRPLAHSLKSEQATFAVDLDRAGSDPYAAAPAFTRSQMAKGLKVNGLNLDPVDPLFDVHWRAFATGSREFIGSIDYALSTNDRSFKALDAFVASLAFGGEAAAVSAAPVPAAPLPALPKKGGTKLSVIFEDYKKKQVARGAWTANTTHMVTAAVEVWIKFAGDRPMGDYEFTEAREFQSVLFDLPPNWGQFKHLAGKPLHDVARIAREGGMKKASLTTVSKRFAFVGSFFKWAHTNWRDEVPANVFDGLFIAKAKGGDARDEREVYTLDDLNKLFKSDAYRALDRNSAAFWVPLISLFGGMRMGEIVQLEKADIATEDGIHYFNATKEGTEGKTIKTAAGRRRVPIHPELIRLGFVEFVQRSKLNGAPRYFMDVSPKTGKGGGISWSYEFSKDFSKFIRGIGLKRDKLNFHSFRHTFINCGVNCGVNGDIMDAFDGHKPAGMRQGRYFKQYELDVLKSAMDEITYRGLDLSHLKT